MISVFLGRVLYFTMKWVHCACSTFITAKITVLHQQIYPKRYCGNKVTPLQSPHKPIFIAHFYNTAYTAILRSVMQTHISDSHSYIAINRGSCFENEGAKNPRNRLLYSWRYKCMKIILIYGRVLRCQILAQRQTNSAISSYLIPALVPSPTLAGVPGEFILCR